MSKERDIRRLAREMGRAIKDLPECAIKCTIARGAFSAERTYYLLLVNNEEFSGTEQTCRLWHRDWHPIGRDEPGKGERIPGLIEAARIGPGHLGEIVAVWNQVDWTVLVVDPENIHVLLSD
jgi:hypothetical protein